MPAPNDLTPEEEAQFVEHGVQPAGPGREPLSDDDGGQQQAQQQPAAADEQPRGTDGKFASKQQPAATDDQQGSEQQQPAANDQQGGDRQQPRMVPHEALHAERERARSASLAAQRATARLNAILAQQNQQNQPEALPDLNEDPAGYVRGLEARLSKFEQERQQETQFRQIDQGLEQDEAVFTQQVPDYEQASDYYVQSRAKELLQFHEPAEAQRILTQEARAIATQAWQRGISAAQVVYNLAQARGYQYREQQQSDTQFESAAQFEQRQQGGGQQQRRGPSAQDTIRSINNGQQASRSLSNGGGAASTQTLNAQALLDMSDEEFEQYLKLGEKGANSRFAQVA